MGDLLNQVQTPGFDQGTELPTDPDEGDDEEWDDPSFERRLNPDDPRDKSYLAGYKSGQLRGEVIRAVSDQDYLDGWWDGFEDANEWDED